ncbi:CDP-alcohol phosphatidyltransferase family protein [Acidaminobacter sp. JC074]|uniref:CDP-alcohol phosphatidyltransferase family protein n=1 Tax=Acidaminobacter sp. JC074 TaxID=2530199 RepID=UPI001F105B33|nr:CDP-alcohol phosphatidyltransferase family protein [Acidaminobacter sp. JC074]MCH4891394.1 CDP-alcohol phosphatidyltransferase family protein [Acidaminobacter sp. JC074]
MLDTHGRKYVQPTINKIAGFTIKLKLSPIHLTIIALLLGLLAAVLNAVDLVIPAVIILWLSGLVDTLDGSVARLTNQKSDLGAFLDITFDRIVELAILYSILFKHPEYASMVFVLTSTFVLSMTVFLTVGSFAKNHSEKSFYYQAGITERTETFIFFTLMILLEKWALAIGYVFAILVIITVFIRFREAIKLLRS